MEIQAEPPRSLVSLIPIYCFASFCLYAAVGSTFLGPYDPHESLLERLALPVLFLVPTFGLTFRLAWLSRRRETPDQKGLGLAVTLPLSLVAVLLGALLVSVMFFGPHWANFF